MQVETKKLQSNRRKKIVHKMRKTKGIKTVVGAKKEIL